MKINLTDFEMYLIGGALNAAIIANKAETTDDILLLHNLEILFDKWMELEKEE